MGRLAGLAKNLLVVAVATLVAILLAEGAVRAFGLVPVNDYRRIVDPGAPWRLRPGAAMVEDQPEFKVPIHINAAGYRDREFSTERAAGTTRIALIGDSFTFGTGVKPGERASALLESRLRESGHPCEVYNFGKPGLDTYLAVDVLERGVAPFRPDLAILMLYLGNDITDNVRHRAQRDTAQEARAVARPSLRTGLLRGLRDRSRLFQFVILRIAGIPALGAIYNRMKASNMVGEIADQLEILDTAERAEERLWGPTREALHAFADASRRLGVRAMVVLIPGRLQYDDRVWNALAASRGLDSARYRRTLPNEVLESAIGAETGAGWIDTLPAFRAVGDRAGETYYPVNGHFTPRGQEVLAGALSQGLEPVVAALEQGPAGSGPRPLGEMRGLPASAPH